jgi:hypothetical protein
VTAEPGAKPDEPIASPSPVPDPAPLLDLTERLVRIERKLSDLAEPLDGSSDRFRQWIEEGYWERIRFSEFLRLKR